MGRSNKGMINGRQKSYMVADNKSMPGDDPIEYTDMKATIFAVSGATPVTIVSAEHVGPNRKFYLKGFTVKDVSGQAGAGFASLYIGDSGGGNLAEIPATLLIASAFVQNGTTGVIGSGRWTRNLGGDVGKGIVLSMNANGSAGQYEVTVWGLIR